MASEESVYNLVTRLVENQLAVNNRRVRHEDVKKLRSKAFELLLYNKKLISDAHWLPNCNCIEYQYLVWEFTLRFTFKQPEKAEEIKANFEIINNSHWDDIKKHTLLHFLLKLRRPSSELQEKKIIPRLAKSGYRIFTEDDFRLDGIATFSNKFSNRSLDIMSHRSDFFTPDEMSLLDNPFSTPDDLPDEGYFPSESELNIWDVVSKLEPNNKRTWQTLGLSVHKSEKPFISECNLDSYQLKEKMLFYYHQRFLCEAKLAPVKVLAKEEYMRDLKYLVLGIESSTFKSSGDFFILNPDVLFDGVPYDAFKNYSALLMNCGSCFRALQNMVSDITYAKAEQYGSIYFEFCNAVSRYLLFYHAATFKFDEKKGMLELHSYFRHLSKQLFAIASICRVGIYKETYGNAIPSGVDLLNYLYTKIFGQSDRNILLVLLGLMFPCFQIYFIRYLRPWLLEGVVNDPHNEFFIRASSKYRSARDRTYWTHGYVINDALVPNFLFDHAKAILDCGKSANFLKLCMPKSKICEYFMANKPHLIQCCITRDMIVKLERCLKNYELEMILASGGMPFSLKNWLAMKEDEKIIFSKCVAMKRVASVKLIQQQRLEKIAKQNKEKNERYRLLREDYDKQLALKEEARLLELARELKEEEKLATMREKAEQLIQEEAARMIAHYEQLAQDATTLDEQITNHVEAFKKIHLDEDLEPVAVTHHEKPVEATADDVLNANSESLDETSNDSSNNNPTEQQNVRETLTHAQRNKQKVMGTSLNQAILPTNKPNTILTEAQRNKMKVMAEEYGEMYAQKTDLEVNRDYAMQSRLTFNDNDFINKNVTTRSAGNVNNVENNNNQNQNAVANDETFAAVASKDKEGNIVDPAVSRLTKYRQERNLQLDIPPPMSDSWMSCLKTPNFEFLKCDSMFTATATAVSSFCVTPMYENAREHVNLDLDCPMRLQLKDVDGIQPQALDYYIRNSLTLPLQVQTSLVHADLVKHLIVEQKFLAHLEHLRNYYFLLDGEYCRSITRDFFRKLYLREDVRSLYNISACEFNDDLRVRFCIKSPPEVLDLGDINVLDCISLCYETKWPTNILLPNDTMQKYDEVFKFLLKVHRVAWVLQNIFMDLKMLTREHAQRATLLSFSRQYQRVQLCRHIMTHFIQTFQNYIVGEVLQSGWASFQESLKTIDNIDAMYGAHTTYLKQIYFLCLLNKQSAPVRKVIMNIFIVILKYYDYMRSRQWTFNEMEFEHPNYQKLEEIFTNFIVLTQYFFKVGRKVARTAYQSQFAQLIDLLDINGYYSACFKQTSAS